MISIVKNDSCKTLEAKKNYSLWVNKTHKMDFYHFREPADLAQVLRDAADAVDLSNNIIPDHLKEKMEVKPKLSMMERLNGIQQHLEKQELDY